VISIPSTTAVAPEFLTPKRSPAIPLMYASPVIAPKGYVPNNYVFFWFKRCRRDFDN
jgi:hypothetical protein